MCQGVLIQTPLDVSLMSLILNIENREKKFQII